MNPDATARPGRGKIRKRFNLGSLMVGVAALAFGLADLMEACRVRVVVRNDSDRLIRSVRVSQEGREARFGPIGPHGSSEARVRSGLTTEPLRVSLEVAEPVGRSDRLVQLGDLPPTVEGASIRLHQTAYLFYDGR